MKDQNDPIVSQNEITSLNLADLDVQELENRLELSMLMAAAPDGGEELQGFCVIRAKNWCFIHTNEAMVATPQNVSSN